MIGTALGAVLEGVDGQIVQVEADVVSGFPHFSIVGLPDSAVTESKLRIRSAIRNAGLEFPKGRITVNLSPASVRKRGAGLDLAIAVAILRAAGQLPPASEPIAFCAELNLSGILVPLPAALNLTLACRKAQIFQVVVAKNQLGESFLPSDIRWNAGHTLQDVCLALKGLSPFERPIRDVFDESLQSEASNLDFSDVIGLERTKRALLIAAAGRHHTLLVGPPGCGKTMLAERFCSLLPPLTAIEALEVYALGQAYQGNHNFTMRPPMRIPHHSLTKGGLIGGGSPPHPGEVSFAHHGVLILDELLEFPRSTLESLREPLIHREVHISRAGRAVRLPCDFILIGTTNPCPCGYRGNPQCVCSQDVFNRYWNKMSGPLLDRIDIVVSIEPKQESYLQKTAVKSSSELREIVLKARARLDDKLSSTENLRSSLKFTATAESLLKRAFESLNLSRRGLDAVRRVSRTIAAMEESFFIRDEHVQEALTFRNNWRNA